MSTLRLRATLAAAAGAALLLAGCAAGGHAHGEDTAPIDGAPEVEVIATSMAFEPARLELEAGEPVNIVMTSKGAFHDLTLDEPDFHLAANRGEQVTGGLVIDEPGTYTAYCSVPGHRSAGMELEIVVR